MSRFIVVVDAGSTRIRCFVFDGEGRVVVRRSAPWSYLDSGTISPYARKLDSDAVWRSTTSLIAGCIGDGHVEASRVAAITVTSQRQGSVFFDEDMRVLYAGPNIDLRAVFEGAAIDDEMGERVFRTTGRLPSFLFAPAKLRWFMQHEPAVADRIDRVATLADWLRWELSGELVSEATLAAEAGLFDVREGRWCAPLLDELGIRPGGGVPVQRAGSVAGGVSPAAAGTTGIPEGVPVVVSPADTQCGLLGLGVGRPGQVGVVAGWSIPLLMLTSEPIFDDARRTWTGCYVEDGLWSLESTCGDAGNAYGWLADTMWAGEARPLDRMDGATREVPAGSEGVLALLGPPRMDMSKIGLRPGGFVFPVPMTFGGIGREHLARAALESMAFSVRANLEQLESVSGMPASSVALGGGMTASSTWVEMLPDVLGRPVQVASEPDVTAAGARFTAEAALQGVDSLVGYAESEAASRTIEPRSVESAEYDYHYKRWTEMARHLESAGE